MVAVDHRSGDASAGRQRADRRPEHLAASRVPSRATPVRAEPVTATPTLGDAWPPADCPGAPQSCSGGSDSDLDPPALQPNDPPEWRRDNPRLISQSAVELLVVDWPAIIGAAHWHEDVRNALGSTFI